MAGIECDNWQASHYSYQDSLTKIKMNGKLSREIKERLGVKQGHINSSDHYKVYIGPCLDMLEDAQLGVWIGPLNSGVSGCADDVFLCTDNPVKLQALIDMAEHYGSLYRIQYGAKKTKVTISGPEIDRQYYKDTQPWKMGGQTVEVVENNEHLGQIVSGSRQEEKNVDLRILKSRNMLFSLLGPAFSFKCLLSPTVKLHIYRTFVCPVIRSGLSSLVLKNTTLSPLSIFQRKVLKGVLQLSKQASTAGIHFLTGELPIEALVHRDAFAIFYTIWSNPNSKIYDIVKYLLSCSTENSSTWSNHMRLLTKQYGLEDPANLMQKDPPSKSSFKNDLMPRIRAFHENDLRSHPDPDQKLKYLNVSVIGLSGRHHPALSGVLTVTDVKKSRSHIKMLIGDLFTYEMKSEQSGGSPHCRLCCEMKNETISHILTFCDAYSDVRNRILQESSYLCTKSQSGIIFSELLNDSEGLCQFILDPTSLNLKRRVNLNDPMLGSFFQLSRDLCFSINEKRLKLLKQKHKNLQSLQPVV